MMKKPLKIGACLLISEILDFRNWLFDSQRVLEIQDFALPNGLSYDFDDKLSLAKSLLKGFEGRLGIHGPFHGLDIDNKDSEIIAIISARLIKALEAADHLAATQMVIHSPFDAWYNRNIFAQKNYKNSKIEYIKAVLDPVIKVAERYGILMVLENIQDVRPEHRKELALSFGSKCIAVSLDTGHAHIAHCTSGAPPVDFYVKDAGDLLRHVHLQDVDGYADRHWSLGLGQINWQSVFDALSSVGSKPHLVLELKDKSDIHKSHEYLKSIGFAE